MVDFVALASIVLNAILAGAAISSAIVARKSTEKLIEEQHTPALDILLEPSGMPETGVNIFFVPVYVVNLGAGVATNIVADATGEFIDRLPVPLGKPFLLPYSVIQYAHEFSFATAKRPITKEEYVKSSVRITYSDITRRRHWQYTAAIEMNHLGTLSVTHQNTRSIKI